MTTSLSSLTVPVSLLCDPRIRLGELLDEESDDDDSDEVVFVAVDFDLRLLERLDDS